MAGAGDTGPLPDETILEGNKSDRITTVVTKGNSAFMGWYDNPEPEGDKITDPYYPTENVTLYASWLDESRVMPESVTKIYVHADLLDSFKAKFPDYADKTFAIAE